MSRQPFATITGCDTGETPPSDDDYNQDVARILDMLGADETCRREAEQRSGSSASAFKSKWNAAVVGLGFGGASGSSKGTTRSSYEDERMLEEGCGAVYANVNQILESVRRINCSVAQSSTHASSSVATNASVSLRIEPIDGAYDTLVASRNLTLDILERTPDAAVHKLSLLERQLARQTGEIDNFGLVDIRATRIEVRGGTQVKQLSTTAQALASRVGADVEEIAAAAGAQALQQEFGAAAAGENVRSLVNNEIERRRDTIQTDIVQSISRSSVDVDSRGNITITSPTRINLTGSVLSADVSVRLITAAVATNAIELGRTVAQEVLSASMGGTPPHDSPHLRALGAQLAPAASTAAADAPRTPDAEAPPLPWAVPPTPAPRPGEATTAEAAVDAASAAVDAAREAVSSLSADTAISPQVLLAAGAVVLVAVLLAGGGDGTSDEGRRRRRLLLVLLAGAAYAFGPGASPGDR